MTKKSKSIFVCSECGYESPKWAGKCVCGAYNTFYEEKQTVVSTVGKSYTAGVKKSEPVKLKEVASGQRDRIETGIGELDRVLGGGITRGSLTLISGEPGIGKSTLILQAAINLANKGMSVLYISGEESDEQIRMRADRISKTISDNIFIIAETDLDAVSETITEMNPGFLIIDSIQTMYSGEVPAAAGGVSQIRVCTDRLMHIGKTNGMPIFIVAHVTKAGDVAGPKIIEHLVDCVLLFSGDNNKDFRLLNSSKNRFGTTSEMGAFEMREDGLAEIADLSECLLEGLENETEGTIATAIYEGTRPLLMELQALASKATSGFPRRTSIGVENARLGMILAVLEKKSGLDLSAHDIYVNIVGGIKPDGTSIDLAVALAAYSSARNIVIPSNLLAIGEVGLAGEIRSVRHADKIVYEAAKLGFTKIILPERNVEKIKTPQGVTLCGVKNLNDAIRSL